MLLRGDQPDLSCTIVDISDSGARLALEDTSVVPDRFTIAMSERGVPRRQCRLVWRGANDVGVSFESDKDDRKIGDRELAPGSTLDDALDVFALR